MSTRRFKSFMDRGLYWKDNAGRLKVPLLYCFSRLFPYGVLLFSFHLSFSQSLPIWEHRVLPYNRYTIGQDFYEMNAPIEVDTDGAVLFSAEKDQLCALHNLEVEELFKGENVGTFQRKYSVGGQLFYGFDRSLYTGGDRQSLQSTQVGFTGAHYTQFFPINKKVYFTAISPSGQQYKLIRWDGHHFHEELKSSTPLYTVEVKGKAYLLSYHSTGTSLKPLEDKAPQRDYPFFFTAQYFNSLDDFYFTNEEHEGLFHYSYGKTSRLLPPSKTEVRNLGRYYLYTDGNGLTVYDLAQEGKPIGRTSELKSAYYKAFSAESQSLYLAGNGQLSRLFTFLRCYPRLYNGTNSDGLRTIVQTPEGKIWVGSANGGFSTVDDKGTHESSLRSLQINYGGTVIGKKVLLNTYHKGLYLFENEHKFVRVNDTLLSLHNYVSQKDILYSCAQGYGIAYKAVQDLQDRRIPWKLIDHRQGLTLTQCQSICEDPFGNLWTISMQGVGIYAPEQDKAHTLHYDKDNFPIRGACLFMDKEKTLWFGSEKGQLYFWKGKGNPLEATAGDFALLRHPLLLGNNRPIIFLHQWQDYLVVGVTNKIFLVDLKSFHQGQPAKVKYLPPLVMGLETPLERACVLTDERDNSLWFASSNMLFQWDIAKWLTLPTFPVEPSISISTGKAEVKGRADDPIVLEANQNSFDIHLHYQSKDNLPRFLVATLKDKNEKAPIEQGVLLSDTEYRFQNLSPGNYTFSVVMCQADGSYTRYEFPLNIKKYFWQDTYFWLVVVLIPAATGLYMIWNMRKIDRQDKEIMLLKLNSLNKQFRPHFMLNALNSLGAELYDKPHAERILSYIGENISIIHHFSQGQTTFIPFSQEWKLTENTIAIQREIFLPNLQVQVENAGAIPDDFLLPMGLLQVIVENSLLHGLRHRSTPPQILRIAFWERPVAYGISISDNGVGVTRSKEYAGLQRHGTGLKTLQRILNILNKHFDHAITITMEDKNPNDEQYPGTITIIQLKKGIDYEKINL